MLWMDVHSNMMRCLSNPKVIHSPVCCCPQIIFFIPYLAVATNGSEPVDDVYAVGKTMFIGIIGAVSLEISLIARYWTWLFFAAWAGSYLFIYPFLIILGLFFEKIGRYDYTQARPGFVAPPPGQAPSCLVVALSCIGEHMQLKHLMGTPACGEVSVAVMPVVVKHAVPCAWARTFVEETANYVPSSCRVAADACVQVGMAYKIFSEPFCWFDLPAAAGVPADLLHPLRRALCALAVLAQRQHDPGAPL